MEDACPDMRAYVGQVLGGRYRLDGYLDEGNFGAVYRASQLAYGVELRQVAIKIGKRPMSEPEARRKFCDALMMARVADSAADATLRQHFVAVYDAGRWPEDGPLSGHPYVAMELVDGGSMSKCLRAGPFPLKRAVAYFDQVLKAMAFMHEQHLIHRDLKPGNVLVSRRADGSDVLKVSDFGLAIEVDELLGWAESGGDLAWLAPESLAENVCSPQTDVYMLGLVFYQMLTGIKPFGEVGGHLRGADREKQDEVRRLHLTARRHLDLRPLTQHEELKSRPAQAEVIRKALHHDAASGRYGSAVEMLADWESAKTKLGGPMDRVEQPWDAVRRLIREAEQSLRIGDRQEYGRLLAEAYRINSDRSQVADSMVSGRACRLMVEWLIAEGRLDDAAAAAAESYGRRRCRGTCLALSRYYAARKSPLAASFQAEANSFADEGADS